MSKLRVNGFSISIDGYGAGPDQDLNHPLGVGGEAVHTWMVGTRTFKKLHGGLAEAPTGNEVGGAGVDDDFVARAAENVGSWILGRNMFGPIRGPWSDDSWKGWWGSNPPYHVPVFVLTHHARAPVTMEGGTTFHFVTDGIHAALKRATEAARGKDVRLGGSSRAKELQEESKTGVQAVALPMRSSRLSILPAALSIGPDRSGTDSYTPAMDSTSSCRWPTWRRRGTGCRDRATRSADRPSLAGLHSW